MTAQASAASMPGRTARCMSAAAAEPVRVDHDELRASVFSRAGDMRRHVHLGRDRVGGPEHVQVGHAISRESAPVTRPHPACHPAAAMAVQIVPLRPDQRIACRRRKMPSLFTSPIVPAEL